MYDDGDSCVSFDALHLWFRLFHTNTNTHRFLLFVANSDESLQNFSASYTHRMRTRDISIIIILILYCRMGHFTMNIYHSGIWVKFLRKRKFDDVFNKMKHWSVRFFLIFNRFTEYSAYLHAKQHLIENYELTKRMRRKKPNTNLLHLNNEKKKQTTYICKSNGKNRFACF